jgi:hypothetical protein
MSGLLSFLNLEFKMELAIVQRYFRCPHHQKNEAPEAGALLYLLKFPF